MEVSDSEEEMDLNEAKTNSKTIEQKKCTSKSSLKKINWSKTKFSIESISQLVKSQNERSYDDLEDNETISNKSKSEKEKNNTNIENNKDKNNKNIAKPSFIYTFTWEEGGEEVKLIGSFSDWKESFNMKKDNKDNVFKISLPLNNELYYYKFIVDGEWKYSKKQPTKNDDQGNINNIIDLTNFFLNLGSNHNTSFENKNSSNNNDKKIKKKKKSKLSNKKSSKKLIKENIDFKKENNDTKQFTEPRKNNVIGNPFNLNNESKQYKIGNKKYYGFEQRNFFSSQKSYLNLSGYRHNILQHILLPKNNKEDYDIKIGLSQRYREKATTIIYYNTSSHIKV